MNGRKIYSPRGRTLGGSSVDQRPDLHPRPAARTTTAGRRSGNAGWGCARGAALLHQVGAQPARRERVSRRRRTAARCPTSASGTSWSRRSSARPASSASRAPTTSTARSRKAPATSSSRRATACAARRRPPTCSPRAGGTTCGRDRALARRHRCSTGGARAGVALSPRRRGDHGARGARGAPVRRRDAVAAAPAALRASGPPRCCRVTASPSWRTCRASARTCRTICSCASSTSARSRSRPTTTCAASGAGPVGLKWLVFRAGPLAVGVMHRRLHRARACPDAKTPDIQFHLSTCQRRHGGGKAASVLRLHDVGLPAAARPAAARSASSRPTRRQRRRMQPNYLSHRIRPGGHGRRHAGSPGGSWRRAHSALRRSKSTSRAATCGPKARSLEFLRNNGDDDLPPGRHLPHGSRRARGRGRAPARSRRRGPARGRLRR